METEQTDVYARITNQILAAMEACPERTSMPWHHAGGEVFRPRNALSEMRYRGVNVLSLWATAESEGYTTGEWATYRQWQELGAQVRKGEKGTTVVFWKTVSDEQQESEEDGEGSRPNRFYAAAYHVFNADQVDGYWPKPVPVLLESQRIHGADRFFAAMPAEVRHGGDKAFYCPLTDHVQMPDFSVFRDSVAYYSVLAHEMTHWTGGPLRLNRQFGVRFGDDAYAMEELVAELGAAFICADLHIENEPRKDHAAYLSSWLKVLKTDKRAIFTAASKAQAACDLLHSYQAKMAA